MYAELPSWSCFSNSAELMKNERPPREQTQCTHKKRTTCEELYPYIQETEEGYVCRMCKVAYDGGLVKLLPGSGAWVNKPIQRANSKKWSYKCAKHVGSRTHEMAQSSLRAFSAQCNTNNLHDDQSDGIETWENADLIGMCFVEF